MKHKFLNIASVVIVLICSIYGGSKIMADYQKQHEEVERYKKERAEGIKTAQKLIAKDVSATYKNIKSIEFKKIYFTYMGTTEFDFTVNGGSDEYSYEVNGEHYQHPTISTIESYPISLKNKKTEHGNDEKDFEKLKVAYTTETER